MSDRILMNALTSRVDSRTWARREAYLYRAEVWKRRRDLAHHLGYSGSTDHPVAVSLDAKQRFQWAEAAWQKGWISTRQFFTEGQLFDAECRPDWTLRVRDLETLGDMRHEERRLRRLSRREWLIDTSVWHEWGQAMTEYIQEARQWQHERQQRTETRRQTRFLREGRATLRSIKAHLRGVAPLQPQA